MIYLVSFEIDIDDADTPRDAALSAWKYIVRSGSTANVFDVTDEQGNTTRVDLQEEWENGEVALVCDDNAMEPSPRPAARPVNRIGVVLEGGLVQAIVADRPDELDAVIIDYDTDDWEVSELLSVAQGDGTESLAAVHGHVVEKPAIDLDTVFDDING